MGINSDGDYIFDHVRYKSVKQRTANFNTWIFVAFDKPNIKLFIYQKIKAK